ncbi:hypothetical protein M569_11907, partial [Genlisea aurea]
QQVDPEEERKVTKYLRGQAADLQGLRDKKLKGQLAVREALYGRSAQAAAKAEKWLMPSEAGFLETEGVEKTWEVEQEDIAGEVGIRNLREQYDIVLPDFGPYTIDFDLSGRFMVAGGRKGHLALMDLEKMDLIREFQVRETVRDAVLLHNHNFFAAAQKNYVYIYDSNGKEVHCLK